MRRDAIAELRRAIDRLPYHPRRAMPDGVGANPLVVGAYTDSDGGICPMLAAHRHGGRHTHLPFARAWDRLAGARRTRLATRRELRILIGQLEASLAVAAHDLPETDLGAAIAEHRELVARRPPASAAAPEPEIRAARLSPRAARRADAEGALARLHELAGALEDDLRHDRGGRERQEPAHR